MKTYKTIIFTLVLGLVLLFSPKALAQSQTFTLEMLAQYDGMSGRRAYFAYEGKVYDVTESSLWKEGQHYGLKAGTDLTGKMEGAPHGTEVFSRVPMVGSLATAATPQPVVAPSPSVAPTIAKQWYEAPIRIAGISLLGWTGIFLSIFFVLNFATCFSMPWGQFPLPWKGSRPGPDALDVAPEHMRFTSIHKYFAWGTVILGILHTVIGFMQLLGYRL